MKRNIYNLKLPMAMANIFGSDKYSNIRGKVYLYYVKNGTLFELEVKGLPEYNKNNFFGFHIHENMECETR